MLAAPTAREILQDPHPILRAVAAPLTPAELRSPDIQALIEDMFATVQARNLIGMAAPQIGVSKRLFVVHFTEAGTQHGPLVMANPKIIKAEDSIIWTEASPCMPGREGEVERHARIQCRGLDRHGKPYTLKAQGLLSVCVQHEIDHLDGVLCFDRAMDIRSIA